MAGIRIITLMLALILAVVVVTAVEVSQNLVVEILPGGIFLNVSSPEEGKTYTTRQIPVSIDFGIDAEFFMLRQDDRDYRTLCRECTHYNNTKPFSEGLNIISIKVRHPLGTEAFQNISFIVETKSPVIRKTFPEKGFTTGLFEVQFQEENPDSLTLNYGNAEIGFRQKLVPISNCVRERFDFICMEEVNLIDFNGQNINYFFTLTDIAGNSDMSIPRSLSVDLTPPIIKEINYTIDKRNVEFVIKVEEDNFNKLEYMDSTDRVPVFKSICSLDRDGICRRTFSFSRVTHSLQIRAMDKAGNTDTEFLNFTII